MTRPDYVPDGAVDITNHGISQDYNPNDPDASTAEDVLNAIHNAGEAAGDGGAIYVPEGTYYYGTVDKFPTNKFDWGGRENGAGLDIYGDGPTKSQLSPSEHIPDDSGNGGPRYAAGTQHGTVTIRGLRLDGNDVNIEPSSPDPSDDTRAGSTGIVLNGGVDRLELINCYIGHWIFRGIRCRDAPVTIKNCTFERNGVKSNQLNGGAVGRHHVSIRTRDGGQTTIRDSKFLNAPGSFIDISDANADYTIEHCYVAGTGMNTIKPSGGNTIEWRQVYVQPRTQFLVDNIPQADDGNGDRHGQRFISQNVFRDDSQASFVLSDVEVRDCTRSAVSMRRYQAPVSGDRIAFVNCNIRDRDAETWRTRSDGGVDFNVNRMSIHNTNGDAFGVGGVGGAGSIGTLRRDGNDTLGDLNGVTISEDNQGADPLQPDVPSADEVGIQTGSTDGTDGTNGTDDSTTTTDIDSPIPDVLHAWRLGEGSGSTAADAAGSADGDITGAGWTSGDWFGDQALDMAEGDHVGMDAGQSDPGDEGTLALTVRGGYSASGDQLGYAFVHPDWREDNKLYVAADNQSVTDKWVAEVGDSTEVPFGDIDTSRRLRLVVTWKNGQITTYVNGEQRGTGTYTEGITLNRLNWYFGAWNRSDTSPSQHLDGDLDNVLLADTAASKTQIQEDYQAQSWVGAPLFDDWMPRWNSTEDDWGVASGSEFEGGYALAFDAGSGDRGRHALSCDVVGAPADVEVLDEFRVPAFPDDASLADHARVHLRSSGDGSENGYWLGIEDGEAFRLAKFTDGTATTLDRFGTPAENTFYYRRVRAEGTELKAKVWPATEMEPSGWDVAVTDGDHADGWVGLGSFDDARVETDAVSVATGGETAQLPSVDSPPTVAWETPTNGATVSGSVTLQVAAGDSEDADDSLTVEYRVDGGSWRSAAYSSDTGFYEDAWDTTAVADGTHGLEARATDAAGNTASAAVDISVDNTIGVQTVDAVDVTDSVATLVGELTDLGGESAADVAFEWRETGGSWSLVGERTLSSVGEYSTDLSGLAADTDHEFRAVVTAPESVNGGTLGFRTATGGSTNSAPVIDQFDVTDKSNPVWSRYYVDWTVSDEDDDLDTIVTELRYGGATVATESTSVSGGSAKFSHELRVRGDVDAIRLTVNDTENAVASETQSV